ncbi:MAG: hypothetical protein R2706_02175 [Acidimicrobiales bacterium]
MRSTQLRPYAAVALRCREPVGDRGGAIDLSSDKNSTVTYESATPTSPTSPTPTTLVSPTTETPAPSFADTYAAVSDGVFRVEADFCDGTGSQGSGS